MAPAEAGSAITESVWRFAVVVAVSARSYACIERKRSKADAKAQ